MKFGCRCIKVLNIPSLPSRECGLKCTGTLLDCQQTASLPSRECGLKCPKIVTSPDRCFVTPFAGVWIEILSEKRGDRSNPVTPFAGVWIEIKINVASAVGCLVTPFAGVWIEIFWRSTIQEIYLSHSLRGSVD